MCFPSTKVWNAAILQAFCFKRANNSLPHRNNHPLRYVCFILMYGNCARLTTMRYNVPVFYPISNCKKMRCRMDSNFETPNALPAAKIFRRRTGCLRERATFLRCRMDYLSKTTQYRQHKALPPTQNNSAPKNFYTASPFCCLQALKYGTSYAQTATATH